MSDKNMSIISKFNIFSEIDQQLVNNIKLFYLNKVNLLIKTIDDSVFHFNLNDKIFKKCDSFRENDIIIKFDCNNVYYMPHYIALTNNGCVYSWGCNAFGQLGNGCNDGCDTPTIINRLSEEFVIDICCGLRHSLVLTRNGDVFAFGSNRSGQCGNDNESDQLTPIKVNISSKVTAISCGDYHSLALTVNSDVFGWGMNE